MKTGKMTGKILSIALACLILGSAFVALPSPANAASKFDIGDMVEVYNTGGVGLLVLNAPCGSTIGGKFDGERGIVLDGPVFCAGYNRWLIRWSDGLEGWSAEDWLKEVTKPVSTKFSINEKVVVDTSTLNVRTDPPDLAYKGQVHQDDVGTVKAGPFYGVPKGSSGFYHFWKVDFGSIVGWCVQDWLEKAPDLVVDSIWTVPAEFCQGDTVEIYTKIANTGTGDAASPYGLQIKGYFDGGKCYEEGIEGLGAGWDTGDYLHWTYNWPDDTSSHTVRVEVDPDDYIAESNEYNNELSASFSAAPCPGTGTINVTSDPMGTSFTLSGPASYSGTIPWSTTDAPEGDYTITWGSIPGYTTPPPETKYLPSSGSISFYGSYAVPDIRIPIADINFGDAEVGSSLDKTTTIYNDGNGTLTINSIAWASGSTDFIYIGPPTPFPIGPAGSQDITIRFAPSSTGLKETTFNMSSNDPDEPDATFDVSGNGTPPGPEVIYVPDGYITIQDAVDAATAGDTIVVRDGTYTENIDVNKDHLTITSETGAEATIVQAANSDDHVFEVTADYVEINGFTVKGATGGTKAGIYLSGNDSDNVEHCIISNNIAPNNELGIRLHYSSNNSLSTNTASNNFYGIILHLSNDNTLNNNTVSNDVNGMRLHYSSNNTLTDNVMFGNQFNFAVLGNYDSHFDNNIDTSNTVDDKPIYYIKNAEDKVYDSSTNAGTFYCIFGNNVTVRDLTLTNNHNGVFFWKTQNSRIENVTALNNGCGISLEYSSNNILNNNAASNIGNGIYLYSSNNNTLTNNTASNNPFGITLVYSSGNTLNNNAASNNFWGINFSNSPSNSLTDNTMSHNERNFSVIGSELPHFTQNVDTSNSVNGKPIQYLVNKDGLVIDSSWDIGYLGIVNCTNMTVKDLTLTNNGQGVLVAYSTNSTVENVSASNHWAGVCLIKSSYNTLLKNSLSSNTYGLYIVSSSDVPGFNTLTSNTILNNSNGILLVCSFDNMIYLNNLIGNTDNVKSQISTNTWNSPEEITYIYKGSTYTNYLGNCWSDYSGSDADGDGIGDTYYPIDSDKDSYPLVEPFENYEIEPSNQPPVADAESDQSVSSGDPVYFDGSNSYDPDGTIAGYKWDFGDSETDTGCHVSHRFRGAMNEPKTYTVTLTVEDNSGATATDSCDITVTPLERIVEVTHEPAIPVPGQPVFARMTVSYNWIHDDTYVVSRIHYESGGFIGVGAISIWDFHSYGVPMPRWAADIFSFGNESEETYSPILEEIHYGGDIFQGIEVDAYDAMNIYIAGWAGISISIGPSLPAPFFETNSACFQPDYTEAPDVPIEAPNLDLAHLCSPGELRVYDSEGRVTGLVNGVVKEEIPYSSYNDNTVIILSPSDTYRYEVVGTDEGPYGLGTVSVEDGETTIFAASDIPTTSGAVHQYTIDWDALSQGEKGVTIEVDSDGDGVFEQTITADATLQPPVAEAKGSYVGDEGYAISFDGSGSCDPDGDIVLYEWDFDGDEIYDVSSASPTTEHTWGDDYAGIITLRVTDDEGLASTDTAEVIINNVPPTVEAGLDQTAECCVDEVAFGGSFTDPGWLDTHTIEWDFGDGETATGTLTPVHTYCTTGDYGVILTVTDDDGGVGTDTLTVTVVDTTPPDVEIEVPQADEALQDGVTLTAAASDLCGVAEVYFYIREPDSPQGTPIGYEDLAATLNAGAGKWEYAFDTTQLPDGYYVALAKAVDIHGNEGWSDVMPFSIRNWAVVELLPASEKNKAGRTMPVKFSLRIAESVDPTQPFVYNEELEIRIYDAAAPSNVLQMSLYGDTARDYRIDSVGELYITNFKTAKKPAQYVVEIWRTSKNFLVGSFTFSTVK